MTEKHIRRFWFKVLCKRVLAFNELEEWYTLLSVIDNNIEQATENASKKLGELDYGKSIVEYIGWTEVDVVDLQMYEHPFTRR